MENNQQQILSEIQTLMASVRSQLEELDAKIAQWQHIAGADDAPIAIDLDLDMEPMDVEEAEPVGVETVAAEPEDIETVAAAGPEDLLETAVVEPEIDEEAEIAEPVGVVDEVADVEGPVGMAEDIDDDLPFFELPHEEEHILSQVESAEVSPVEAAPAQQNLESKRAVIDVMARKHAWRTAMPGTPVKDVRGAIALMDRVLFINTLFGTDAMAFQDTLNQINQMSSLDDVVGYLATAHPEWDFDSDVVYSFMMAVRRKVR
ncbi:MAG: hypothetical protein E7111_08900 [Bacteroidales bacterium]|nr:hypothetical protein [Bacteroidales bacterium]